MKTGKTKGLALILVAISMVVVGSYALFTDDTQNEVRGQMGNISIITEMTGGREGLLEKGDTVTYNLKTRVDNGEDVKIRQKIKMGDEGLKSIEEGNIELKIDGVEPSISDLGSEKGYVTPISRVTSLRSKDTSVTVAVDGELVNGIPETELDIEIITEALQDRNTNNSDFEEVSKVEF